MVGLTGLEPVTLRLSSACSNQLSYRPELSRLLSLDTVPVIATGFPVARASYFRSALRFRPTSNSPKIAPPLSIRTSPQAAPRDGTND